jgi:hypothetical protein
MKILDFFLFLWVIFALLDPDPDPAIQINEDPCGSGYGSVYPGKWNEQRQRIARSTGYEKRDTTNTKEKIQNKQTTLLPRGS